MDCENDDKEDKSKIVKGSLHIRRSLQGPHIPFQRKYSSRMTVHWDVLDRKEAPNAQNNHKVR